jgi:CheY-like chemotaxis protein
MAPRTILVVDDDPFVLDLITDVLTAAGYTSIATSDPFEGIRLAETQPVGLILVDNDMPGMTGLQTVHRLRQNPRTRHIPVVLITGGTIDVNAVEEAGCIAFLPKPMPFDTLYRIVAEVLGRSEP